MSMQRTSGAIVRSAFLEVNARRSFVSSAKVLAKSPLPSPESSQPTPPATSFTPSPLSPSAPAIKKHNALTVGIVTSLAKLMGYNNSTTKAIRVTSDLYDRCAERAEIEADFWYNECQLPRTFQTWFQITTLHVYMLLTRFRALPTSKQASNYSQEIINHFFIDAESRMRVRFSVNTSRLIKGYMKDMHTQHRGAILSMDEALAISARGETDHEKLGKADAILAAALWRNIWGAGGWGQGVGGVKRKVKGVDRPDEKKANNKASSEAEEEEGLPELAQDTGIEISGRGAYAIAAAQEKAQQRGFTPQSVEAKSETLLPAHDLEFAVSLEKLVTYIRRELVRLGELSDEEIESGIVAGSAKGEVKDEFDLIRKSQSAASFGKISE